MAGVPVLSLKVKVAVDACTRNGISATQSTMTLKIVKIVVIFLFTFE